MMNDSSLIESTFRISKADTNCSNGCCSNTADANIIRQHMHLLHLTPASACAASNAQGALEWQHQ
jgi:hypothetical protein